MLLRERERRRGLRFQAQQFAESGQYQSWREVEAALLRGGRLGAADALAEPSIRLMLDRRCASARRTAARNG